MRPKIAKGTATISTIYPAGTRVIWPWRARGTRLSRTPNQKEMAARARRNRAIVPNTTAGERRQGMALASLPATAEGFTGRRPHGHKSRRHFPEIRYVKKHTRVQRSGK